VGITSLGTALLAGYDDLNEKQRRGFIQQIAESSDKLESPVKSTIDLSKLRSLSFCLKIKAGNLSELTHHRIALYNKLFLYDSEQKFIINVADNMIVKYGDYYIKQAIDNLIRSAMWQEPQLRDNAYSQV
jgi:K+-sensing histidine kinase KdpD